MKIETVKIKNFRCFGPEGISVSLDPGVTSLVGGNGSGKTAIFEALSRLFGINSRQRTVTRRDFHIPHDCSNMEDQASLEIEVIFGFPEFDHEKTNAQMGAVPEFFWHLAASGPGEPLKARIRLHAVWTDDNTPEGTIEENIRWITTLDDEYKWDDCHPMRDAERRTIQLIYIPAARDARSEITKLLNGRLWKAAHWSQKFRDTITDAAQKVKVVFDNETPSQYIIERLTHRWKEVNAADTDTTPAFRLIENRFEELVRNANITFWPDEGGRERAIDDLSDGQRSLFHISLTAATLEIEREALNISIEQSPFEHEKLRQTHLTLLAIEEPENSLSPFFLSRIIKQARDIASFSTAQVAFSSHSPSILRRISPEEVRYLKLDRKKRKATVNVVVLPDQKEEAEKFVRLAVEAHPEIYFARYVILCEGDSERYAIPRIAQAMGVDFDPSFVPIVPLLGRHVQHYWKLLSGLDIPFATLLDLDLGRKHGGVKLICDVVKKLENIGINLDNHHEIDELDDHSLISSQENNSLIQSLKTKNVFFSYPLDFDFSMLRAFGKAYKQLHWGGNVPKKSEEIIKNRKNVILKSGGDPSLYGDEFDDEFAWYPYLFLLHSKPQTHNFALANIDDDDLAQNAPSEIRNLVEHVGNEIDSFGL